MKIKHCILCFLLLPILVMAQPNCTIIQDSTCRIACEYAVFAGSKYQGSKYSQELLDQSIALCPSAYAYYEKSVPYLKQGLISQWKNIIDKAVELDSSYLLNRGCNQILFYKNYENGLRDLDRLYKIKGRFYIGTSPNGDYDIQLIRAIAYRKIGQPEMSLQIIKELLKSKEYSKGVNDGFHIGITYMEVDQLGKAKHFFDEQSEYNDFADIFYYYSKVLQKEGKIEEAKKMLIKGIELYQAGRHLSYHYYHYPDKIFLKDFERELDKLSN